MKLERDMAAIVQSWLTEKGLKSAATKQGTRSVFATTIEMQHAVYPVVLYTKESNDFFGVYAYVPFKIAEEHRSDWLDITSRTNWDYAFARLEINPVNGEFRCSSTAVLPDSELSTAMVEKMTMFLVDWLDSFLPFLQTLAEAENLS